jgi:hypothetical protein
MFCLAVCHRTRPCLKRIQPMPNVPLAYMYVSVYLRMSDIFHTLAYASTIRNSVTGPLGTLFSEELSQRRDVVSLSFWKLYIPYPIGAFPRRYGKLSGIQCKRIASDLILLRYETSPSRRAGSSLKQGGSCQLFWRTTYTYRFVWCNECVGG